MNSLYTAWSNRSVQTRRAHEGRKIAIRGDRKSAALAASIHLIPVATCICIVALNIRGYYIGGELSGPSGQDIERLAGLQFAAKLHELSMNASIAAILFSYIRYEVTFGDGLPFGAMFAGLQFRDISFLWSMELVGAARAKSLKHRRTMIALIIGCTLLGVSVGPSSANILKPRLDWWEAGGTDFWINTTRTDLYPLQYLGTQVPPSCATYADNTSCPSGDWSIIMSHYMRFWGLLRFGAVDTREFPSIIPVSSSQSVRNLVIHSRSPYQLDQAVHTKASVSYAPISDALNAMAELYKTAAAHVGHGWRFQYRLSQTFSAAASQPAVLVCCYQNGSSPSQVLNDAISGPLLFYNISDWATFSRTGDYPLIPYQNSSLKSHIITALNASTPSKKWLTLPESSFGNASLGIVVVIPAQSEKNINSSINLCTIDATVGPTIMQLALGDTRFLTSPLPSDKVEKSSHKIFIEPEWAEYIFPQDAVTNTSTFDQLLEAAGLWNITHSSTYNSTFNSTIGVVDNTPYALEALLATSIVNGLGRASYSTSLAGKLVGDDDQWMSQLMPANGAAIGYGGNAFTLANQSPDTVTQFTLQVKAQGYAYSSSSSTTILSITILLIYCTLAFGHTFYMIRTGLSSSSWDTISEITTLAMNSDRTNVLVNTGAGIETSIVFREMIHVKADGDRLQFVFNKLPQGVEKVEKNAYYG